MIKNSAEWTNSAKACFGIPEGVQRYVEWLSLFIVKWHIKRRKPHGNAVFCITIKFLITKGLVLSNIHDT